MVRLRVVCGVGNARRQYPRIQHAVLLGASKAMCGEEIRLVLIFDWHMPFVPTLSSSCRECVRLLARRVDS